MNLERAILRLNRSVREIKRLRYDALKRSRKKKRGAEGNKLSNIFDRSHDRFRR